MKTTSVVVAAALCALVACAAVSVEARAGSRLMRLQGEGSASGAGQTCAAFYKKPGCGDAGKPKLEGAKAEGAKCKDAKDCASVCCGKGSEGSEGSEGSSGAKKSGESSHESGGESGKKSESGAKASGEGSEGSESGKSEETSSAAEMAQAEAKAGGNVDFEGSEAGEGAEESGEESGEHAAPNVTISKGPHCVLTESTIPDLQIIKHYYKEGAVLVGPYEVLPLYPTAYPGGKPAPLNFWLCGKDGKFHSSKIKPHVEPRGNGVVHAKVQFKAGKKELTYKPIYSQLDTSCNIAIEMEMPANNPMHKGMYYVPYGEKWDTEIKLVPKKAVAVREKRCVDPKASEESSEEASEESGGEESSEESKPGKLGCVFVAKEDAKSKEVIYVKAGGFAYGPVEKKPAFVNVKKANFFRCDKNGKWQPSKAFAILKENKAKVQFDDTDVEVITKPAGGPNCVATKRRLGATFARGQYHFSVGAKLHRVQTFTKSPKKPVKTDGVCA